MTAVETAYDQDEPTDERLRPDGRQRDRCAGHPLWTGERVSRGPGLDPDSVPDPLAPENILRGSGRGIFLIKAFMDEVHFRQLHPGTELTLIKHRKPAQPGN